MAKLTPLLHITLPEEDGEDRHFAPIIPILQAMIAVNRWHMQRALAKTAKGTGVPIPPLYTKKANGDWIIRYKEDPPGEENWKDCLQMLIDGHGDCDRLVAYRCAERNVAGIDAEPAIKWQQVPKQMMIQLGHPAHMVPDKGVSMVHVVVRYPDPNCPKHGGRYHADADVPCTCPTEDPSKILGMGGNYTSGY